MAAVPPPLAVSESLPEPAPFEVSDGAVNAPRTVVIPDLVTESCAMPPTRRRIRNDPAALDVSVTSSSQPSKVVAPEFHVAVEAIGLATLVIVPRVKVFAPKKD